MCRRPENLRKIDIQALILQLQTAQEYVATPINYPEQERLAARKVLLRLHKKITSPRVDFIQRLSTVVTI